MKEPEPAPSRAAPGAVEGCTTLLDLDVETLRLVRQRAQKSSTTESTHLDRKNDNDD